MIDVGDPYGFETVTVFQVRRAERNNCLGFRYPVTEISEMPQVRSGSGLTLVHGTQPSADDLRYATP
jgi:hypothetical protein